MGERIRDVRKTLGLTQQEFSDRIGVSRNSVASYETGVRTPLDSVVTLIVRTFNVNEHWLRTGEGEMFNEVTQDDRIAEFVGEALAGRPEHIKRRMLSALSKLREEDWDAVDYFVQVLLDEKAEREQEDKKED